MGQAEETERHGSDICWCGDYRSHHDERGCKVCRGSTAPWDGCVGFRFAHKADAADLATWRKYNAPLT